MFSGWRGVHWHNLPVITAWRHGPFIGPSRLDQNCFGVRLVSFLCVPLLVCGVDRLVGWLGVVGRLGGWLVGWVWPVGFVGSWVRWSVGWLVWLVGWPWRLCGGFVAVVHPLCGGYVAVTWRRVGVPIFSTFGCSSQGLSNGAATLLSNSPCTEALMLAIALLCSARKSLHV